MTSSANKYQDYPYFLQDYGQLLSHFQAEFEHLTSKQRGDAFAVFTQRLVPHTEAGRAFDRPQLRKQTYDEGVDLECKSKDGSEWLDIQAKYTIASVDDVDSIISKFESYRSSKQAALQQSLFAVQDNQPQNHYMIVTTQDINSRIIPRYEKSNRPSVRFYNILKDSKRIHIIDGPRVLDTLREVYTKSFHLPCDLQLTLAYPYIRMGDVYIGIVAASELKRLYTEFGDALFFENIREDLGVTSGKVKSGGKRQTVNEAIAQTLDEAPDKFLARNNGITFRASSVSPVDTSALKLNEGSIVNGCQTTMSIVRNTPDNCFALVKVVQATDTWDIAKAANFQNKIDQLDLELAEFIRPQKVRANTSVLGVQYKGQANEESAFAVVDAIYNQEITHEEFRALFLALFSSSPRNAITANYTEVNFEVVRRLFQDGNVDKEIAFEALLAIQKVTREGAQELQDLLHNSQELADLFQRFWKDDKPYYRAFLAVLAASGFINADIYSKPNRPTYEDVLDFLRKVHDGIDNRPNLFLRYYQLAFQSVAFDAIKEDQDRSQTLQYMQTSIARASFDNLYSKLLLMASLDPTLKELTRADKKADS